MPQQRTYHRPPVPGRASILVLMLAVLAGCSGNSFVARRFDDFTAHYNKFYNANRTYRQQERKLREGDVKIDTDHYLAIYDTPQQRGRSAEFEKVITKSADLLRNHPKSKWVDDALMLIGKSYFYQGNFVGAEQKFNEIINLDGKLKEEAEFWLARTLVAGQSRASAEDIIGASLAEEDLDKKWRAQFLLLRGDLRTDEGLFQAAIDDIEDGIREIDKGDIAARALFLLGQLYESEGQFEEAADAYRRVQSKKPLYELSYAAHIGRARAIGMHLEAEDGLAILERMMRDNKNYQNRYHLAYMHARLTAAAGDPDGARSEFREQLYPNDPTRKTALRGEVHYRLGEIYRDYLGDFYSAGLHFDTASSVLRTPTTQNQEYAPDAIVDAKELAATFREYRETRDQLHRMDSLLYLGTLDQAAFDSAVAAVRVHLAEEAARIQEELERRKAETRFRQAATANESNPNAPNRQPTVAATSGTFGFLNHKNLQRVQEAFLDFKDIWGDRPLVPNWRREEAVALAQRAALQEAQAKGEVDPEAAGQIESVRFLPPVDIFEVPRDSASQAKMHAERAEARYRLANVLFLSIGLPDSAAVWYRKVIDEDGDQSVAARALYAMAEVHDALGDQDASLRTFERVIEKYPDSDFAARARARLGYEAQESNEVTDSLEVATARYDEVYRLWMAGEDSAAINGMLRLAADYPTVDLAAKAMLAAARIFLETANRTGSDYYADIPLRDSLFTQQEIEDAIAAATPPPEETHAADSTAADSTAAPQTVGTDSTAVARNAVVKPTVAQTPSQRLRADTAQTAKEVAEPKVEASRADLRDNLRRRREALESKLGPQGTEPNPPGSLDDEVSRVAAVRDNAPADSTRTGDTVARLVPESGQVPADSTNPGAIVSDSVVVASVLPDSAAPAVTDSLSVPVVAQAPPPKPPDIDWKRPEYFINDIIPVPTTLHTLYASVTSHFGDTPYGKRAMELQKGLEAARMELAVAELQKARDEANAAQVPVTPRPKPVAPQPGDTQPAAADSVSVPLPGVVAPDSSQAESLLPGRRANRQGDP